jgi:hypothetical protein
LALVFSPISAPKTNAFWGEFVQEIFHFGMQKVKDVISSMFKGKLKQQAVSSLNSQVDRLMGGTGNSGAAFITNWEDYLLAQPKSSATAYINDYVSQMTAGRNSLTGYRSEGFSGSNGYITNLSAGAVAGINNMESLPRPTYEGNPSQMFEAGNFKNFNLYASGVNNPWAFNMNVKNEYLKKLEEEKEIKKTTSIAYQGFKGTSGEGSTITFPGSLAKDNIANVQNIPNLVLAQASDVPEIVTSTISGMLTKMMGQGFQSLERSSQSETNVQARMNSHTNSSVSQSGPEARFNTIGN